MKGEVITEKERYIRVPKWVIDLGSLEVLIFTFILTKRNYSGELVFPIKYLLDYLDVSKRSTKLTKIESAFNRLLSSGICEQSIKLTNNIHDLIILDLNEKELFNFNKEYINGKFKTTNKPVFSILTFSELKQITKSKEIIDSINISNKSSKINKSSVEKLLIVFVYYKMIKIRRSGSNKQEYTDEEYRPEFAYAKDIILAKNLKMNRNTIRNVIMGLEAIDLIVTEPLPRLFYNNHPLTNYYLIVDKKDGWQKELKAAKKIFGNNKKSNNPLNKMN